MTVTWNDGPLLQRLRQAAMRGVVSGTEEVRNEMISLILNTQKTGRVYRRRGVQHQASAPGEPPASDTGRLVNSTTTDYDQAKLMGTVTARTAYAAALEYGTVRMAPRPYARPAAANTKEFIEKAVGDEVASALASAGIT